MTTRILIFSADHISTLGYVITGKGNMYFIYGTEMEKSLGPKETTSNKELCVLSEYAK
jgi:hypothetical protein